MIFLLDMLLLVLQPKWYFVFFVHKVIIVCFLRMINLSLESNVYNEKTNLKKTKLPTSIVKLPDNFTQSSKRIRNTFI